MLWVADFIFVLFEKFKLIANGQNLAKQTQRKNYLFKILFQIKIILNQGEIVNSTHSNT